MKAFNDIIRADLLGKDKMCFAVKANIGCGHTGAAFGSTPGLRGWAPADVSPVVKKLVANGHVVAAIAHMHELAFGITSENPCFGDVDNPRKPGYTAGGSSGGSGAGVAMGAVPFALGTDTGGSVRIPASLCGVVGYRPTTGLYDTSTVLPLSSTTDTIGVLAQEVAVVQAVHSTVVPSYSPKPFSLKGARIGVPRQYYFDCLDSEVSRTTEAALSLIKGEGAHLVEVNFDSDLFKDVFDNGLQAILHETNRLIPMFLKQHNAPVGFDELCHQIADPNVKHTLETAGKVTNERYKECLQFIDKFRSCFDDYFTSNNLEAFVIPTTILPSIKRPTPQSVEVAGHELNTFAAFVHNTLPQSIADVPSVSIPSGLTADQLPVGLEVVAPRNMDSNLLNIAATIQAVLPPMPQLDFVDFK